MKRILFVAVAAFMLAAPVSGAALRMNPEAQKQEKSQVKNLREVTFSTNMHCRNCMKKLNENLAFMKGVKSLDVSLENQTIVIRYDGRKTDEKILSEAVKKLGYKAEIVKGK